MQESMNLKYEPASEQASLHLSQSAHSLSESGSGSAAGGVGSDAAGGVGGVEEELLQVPSTLDHKH